MPTVVVPDSNILIASALSHPLTDKAKSLLQSWKDQKIELAAPTLFPYEIISVTRRYVHSKVISPDDGLEIRDRLLAYPVQLHFDDQLLKRAYEIATIHNRPTAYDSQYLAVAEKLNCDFWTADERLYNSVHDKLTWVKWLGNFSPT